MCGQSNRTDGCLPIFEEVESTVNRKCVEFIKPGYSSKTCEKNNYNYDFTNGYPMMDNS